MKRTFALRMMLALAVVAGALRTAWVVADEGEKAKSAPTAQCLLMPEPIDPSVRVATDSGPAYFCCTGCIEKYKANPAKFSEKLAAQQKELEKLPRTQVTCPISGEPIDNEVFVEKDGKKVHFCCKKCKAKYEEKPDEYTKALANSYTIQTTCPMDGKPIDPKATVEFTNGQTIYFCSPDCAAKVKSDVAAAKPKLAEMNIYVDPATLKGA